ncbi:MAG: glycosyltransferase family 4 protein [Fluviicola sp.]|nr:glycosyltransferase family 4 protein [Fluviicola sp.]
MKILYITSKPIYPKVDGGCVAMENFLHCLFAQDIEVKHLSIATEKHPFNATNDPNDIREKINTEAVTVKTNVTPLSAFIHLFRKGSYNVRRFYSEEMEQLIAQEIQKENYDAIILDSLYTSVYLDSIRKHFDKKIIARIHNIESDIWDDYAQNETNFLKKIYLKKLAKDLRNYEVEALNKVDGVLSITEDDKQILEKIGVKTPCISLAVSISVPQKITTDYKASNIFHLGAMNWQPNIEAVHRLIKLFPKIRQQSPTVDLHLAGGNFPKEIEKKKSTHIHIDGFVEDVQSFASNSGILVSPIVSGSGVRIKILEMMAIGIPVVTTKLGAQGVNYSEYNCLLVADSDQEIIDATIELIKNEELRKEIGSNAIDYLRKNHSIGVLSKQLIEFIEKSVE